LLGALVEATRGKNLLSPGCLRWEIGNAFSAMLKRQRLSFSEVQEALSDFKSIPISEIEIDLDRALILSERNKIYAYDAYYLEASKQRSKPLLTLDSKLREVAVEEKIRLEEF